MKALRMIGFIGLAVGFSGCASMTSQSASQKEQGTAISPEVEQLMLQSAQSVEKTLNELVLIEKGPTASPSETALIDSTAARPQGESEGASVKKNKKSNLPTGPLLATEKTTPEPEALIDSNSNIKENHKTYGSNKKKRSQNTYNTWISPSAERQAANPEQVWGSSVQMHWKNDALGFIKTVAAALNYEVKIKGQTPVWPPIHLDSTNTPLNILWARFKEQTREVAHFEVSDTDRTILITYDAPGSSVQ